MKKAIDEKRGPRLGRPALVHSKPLWWTRRVLDAAWTRGLNR